MKKVILITVVMCTVLGTVHAHALTPAEIIKKIDDTGRVSSSEGMARQIITTSGGKKRTLEFRSYSKDRNDKQLVIYTAPKRVKGDKILMINEGDDIWFYTPKTDRVRHLASHARKQKVQGSDFAYEDLAGGSIEEDYTYTLVDEEKIDGTRCYQFELVPTESGPHYSKLVLWADKETYVTTRIDYYEDGELLKRLRCYDIRNIDGHWCAMKLVMTNLQEGGQTVMETLEVKFDIPLEDTLFSTRSLKRR
jgi:outer membrane lipoprotein-sorting protein